MMKYLQRLGKSLMLPVAVLPVAGILYGIGYWIDPNGWGSGSAIAMFLIKTASAIIDNMGILFAVGISVGMSKDSDGTACLAGLVSWLIITTLLSPASAAVLRGFGAETLMFDGTLVSDVDAFKAAGGVVFDSKDAITSFMNQHLTLLNQVVPEGDAVAAQLSQLFPNGVAYSRDAVASLTAADPAANLAFSKIQCQFIGILAGIIGATCYNKFGKVKLPDFLGFFSGKRCVAIITAVVSLVVTVVLLFVWPIIFAGLIAFGKWILGLGAIGAGIYAIGNRLLIPFGLHHALNSIFWFDMANINDIGRFWNADPTLTLDIANLDVTTGKEILMNGTTQVTGMYQAGFFPMMMFGIPAAALAMYLAAKKEKRGLVLGLLSSAALSSFLTGITEPFEFAFMFLAPALYGIHALLTGISVAVTAFLPARAGFNFSAGLVDYVLSWKAPGAQNCWILLILGVIFALIYFVVFYFAIKKFDLKTPGREDDEDETKVVLANNNYTEVAKIILEGVGGKSNVASIDNCITRLRLEVKDYTRVDEKKIKTSGCAGVIRPSKTSVQVIIGTQVQFVANEFKALCK